MGGRVNTWGCAACRVDHQAHHGGVLAHADAGDVGVVGLDLGDQFAQLGAQVNALDVHRQARRVVTKLPATSGVGLDGDARILGRRPHAHGHDAGAAQSAARPAATRAGDRKRRLRRVGARWAAGVRQRSCAHALSSCWPVAVCCAQGHVLRSSSMLQ